MGKITLERVKQLEEIGEDVIFDRILSGEAVRTMLAKWRMGWRAWYRWVDSVEGRRARYDQVLMQAGHSYAQRAVETAQNATSENVNVEVYLQSRNQRVGELGKTRGRSQDFLVFEACC